MGRRLPLREPAAGTPEGWAGSRVVGRTAPPGRSASHPWNQCVQDTTEQRDAAAVFRDLAMWKPSQHWV